VVAAKRLSYFLFFFLRFFDFSLSIVDFRQSSEADCAVVAVGSGEAAVGRDCQTDHVGSVTIESFQLCSRFEISHPDGIVRLRAWKLLFSSAQSTPR